MATVGAGDGASTRRPAARRSARPGREPDPDRAARTGADADPDADPESAARTVCLNLLSLRARSRAELAEELARRGTADDVATTVLDRLEAARLVDDAAFAEQWVDSRHRHRGLGRRALADELRRKGVDAETVGTAVAELSPDDERARARELVDKRLPSLDRVDAATATRRLVGMLARKGYGAGVAYDVVRDALGERTPDREPDAGQWDAGEWPGVE